MDEGEERMSSQAAAVAAPSRRNTAALVWHQVRYEQLSFWRNPQSAFFIFAFPLVFFAILAGVFGNAKLGTISGRPVTGLQYYTSTILAACVMEGPSPPPAASRAQAGPRG